MFDIGFSELVLTALVALIVFGPEKLPKAARTAGLWIGRFRRVLTDTRREIERELGADEVRRQLHNESIMKSLNETPQAIQRVLNETVETVKDIDQPKNIDAVRSKTDDAV
jgi:sec-independent protein translocase protein TatB